MIRKTHHRRYMIEVDDVPHRVFSNVEIPFDPRDEEL
jgi:hypothetical protein